MPFKEVSGTGEPKVPGDALPGMKSARLKRFTSENGRLENPTPTSGPGGRLRTPGGKCCWMMNPAVRLEKALVRLLRKEAVPALPTDVATSSAVGSPPRTTQTPRT